MPSSIPSYLVVDNYDSFTYNLVHLLEDILQSDIDVLRADDVVLDELVQYEAIVLSPGPGLPDEHINLLPIVKELILLKKKTLGVCLGMQAMAMAEGMKLKNLHRVHHGVSHELIEPELNARLYLNIEKPLMVGRYHSWVIDESSLNSNWKITGRDSEGEVMSIENESLPLFAIQYHPESVLTPQGKTILKNFVES